ncbi:YqzE family protein [Cohnella yongneupensis]|uniref:YqzE family protein n=1 Tax=Cohnella yongneupensis TaxID=425006 RepID=A0ABW0R052_9BACL
MGDNADYLKFMTEKVVSYLDKSPEAAQTRQERKQLREPWVTRWFGVVPLGVSMWWGKLELRKNKDRAEAQSVQPPQ